MENTTQTKSAPYDSPRPVKSKSFSESFRLMKAVTLGSIALAALAVIVSLGMTFMAYNTANSRVYMVTKNGTLMGDAKYGDPEARYYEIKSHINDFMNSMFEFDENSYEKNVNHALELIGQDGKTILKQYQNSDVYGTVVKNNARLFIEVDSMVVDSYEQPYTATVYARQIVRTMAAETSTFMWAELELSEISRSDENVHGLLIENFKVFNNDAVPAPEK